MDLFDGKTLDGWEHVLIKPELKMTDVWSVRELIGICFYLNHSH